MKVKVISRNPDHYLRETKLEIHKQPRNYDPNLHPLQSAREYVRALNVTKLDRLFAKPFLGSLDGHKDAISCVTKHPTRLSVLLSGAYDGEVRVWDVPQKRCIREFFAHDGVVRDAAYTMDGRQFLTIGADNTIKTWSSTAPQFGEDEEPINTIISKNRLANISMCRKKDRYATCGEGCQLWEMSRNNPIKIFNWGVDTVHSVTFNPIQYDLLGSCGEDNSIILYDTRAKGTLRKVIMTLRPNKLVWNPMEAYMFTVANEDYNLYTYDMRHLTHPMAMYKDHVAAVIDVDYAPTGKEFVSGGYDKTIRIFEVEKERSREVYYTQRMQRLTCVQWTLDNKYILCGSDEMNLRIWKARASEKLGPLKHREKAALNYAETLKTKYAMHPQIKRIARHRHVPKFIYNLKNEHSIIEQKLRRKEQNRKKHAPKGKKVHSVPEIQKHVVDVKY